MWEWNASYCVPSDKIKIVTCFLSFSCLKFGIKNMLLPVEGLNPNSCIYFKFTEWCLQWRIGDFPEGVRQLPQWRHKPIITGRNEVLAKVIFLHLSVIHSVHGGGGRVVCGHLTSRPPPGPDRPLWDQTPPGTRPPGTRPPRDQTPPRPDTPPRTRHLPWSDPPPPPPPPRSSKTP